MLTGTTYAWYTDSVTSGKNTLIAGNLDVGLLHDNRLFPEPKTVDQNTDNLFKMNRWEPGCIAYENFQVRNEGSLGLKYRLSLNITEKNSVTINGTKYDLTDVIKIKVVNERIDANATRADILGKLDGAQTLSKFMTSGTMTKLLHEDKISPGKSDTFGVILYWDPTDNDDIYNINNEKVVSDYDKDDPAHPNRLRIDIGVNLVATQLSAPEDANQN